MPEPDDGRDDRRDDRRAEGRPVPDTLADDMRGLVREELGNLGFDVSKGLPWPGHAGDRPTLVLSTMQKVWAIALGVAAMLAFLATFAQGWAAGFTWMCQVGWITTWCAPPG
jgi:hypothetical protein